MSAKAPPAGRSTLATIRDAIQLLHRADPRTFAIAVGSQLGAASLTLLQLVVARRVLDDLVGGARTSGASSGRPILAALVALGLFVTTQNLLSAAQAGTTRLLAESSVRYVRRLLLRTASQTDLEDFERPAFYDRLQRADVQGTAAPLQIATGAMSLGAAVPAVLAVTITLTVIEPLLLPALVVGSIPFWLISARAGSDVYNFSFGHTTGDRVRADLENLVFSRESAKEVRAFEAAGFLVEQWERHYDARMEDARGVARRQYERAVVGSASTLVALGGLGFLVAWLVSSGRIGIADAGVVALGARQLGTSLQSLALGGSEILAQGRFLADTYAFIHAARRDDVGRRPVGAAATTSRRPALTPGSIAVQAEDVVYRYPSTPGALKPDALSGVNLSIAPGEVVALVGENGAGKTTLVKLLCGLYRPTSGAVRWRIDGVELTAAELRRRTAVVFQDFVRYPLTLFQNIAIGDVFRPFFIGELERVADRAGCGGLGRRLQYGFHTMLTPQYEEGVDLSVGQWQRVALARALFRGPGLVVLDEPTASLDPIAEAELFANMRELFPSCSILLITHRFTGVRQAERIHVISGGQIVESGTHEQLDAIGGLYAQMYQLQSDLFGSNGQKNGLPLGAAPGSAR